MLLLIIRFKHFRGIIKSQNVILIMKKGMSMDDKNFLTYNQQMKKLRQDKKITCNGSVHKRILVRTGYFNLVNGYKTPFVTGVDSSGEHIYLPETSLDELFAVKDFDDQLRSFLLRYITKVEEEVRTLTGYKLDEINDNGKVNWFDTSAYSSSVSMQQKMSTISKAYDELSRSHLAYVKFYMANHKTIPTWIMVKGTNFSTFINILECCDVKVKHSICKLYGMLDKNGFPSVKLLIGSLNWMRLVRNSCAHNERIYCISQTGSNSSSGRILERYFRLLRPGYLRDREKKVFDLFVYFKYYLPADEFQSFMTEFKSLLFKIKGTIHEQAFDNVRAQIGIKDTDDLDILVSLPKSDINYNRFDRISGMCD